MGLRVRLWLCAIAMCAVWLSGCGEEGEDSASAAGGGRGGNREGGRGQRSAAAIPVKAETVSREDMHAYLETFARLEAERQVTVLARATGLVEALDVEEGDRVREGQVLATLDQEEASLRVRQMRLAHEEAKVNFERYGILHDSRMVSQTEYEATRLRYENTKIDLEEAEYSLAQTTIRAPISGIVMRRLVELGDLVRNNQEIVAIADLDLLLVRIYIPERQIYQVHAGQEATISVESVPGRTFDGKIRMISPEVIPESGTVKVTLETRARSLLRPGMFAVVRIVTDRHPQALVVPKKALVLETEEDDVYAVEDGVVRSVSVELGLIEGDRVEILSGLKDGDRVVTVGHDGLKDGTAVRVVGENTPQIDTPPVAEAVAGAEGAAPRRGARP